MLHCAVNFDNWIGRTETQRDVIAEAPLRALAALLDCDAVWTEAPPLAHWLYFIPTVRQSQLGIDGHAKRGGFLPPIELTRRMWAGGRLEFHAPLAVGATVERRSTIKSISRKSGASGEMVFVTVKHILSVGGRLAVIEEQDIVYRGVSGNGSPSAVDARVSNCTRSFNLDTVALFRFSALTFNAHRIHYDRDYTTKVEGYPGLVAHGPFIATLLMHHLDCPLGSVRKFSFRAQRPLFDNEPAELCRNDAGELWCRNGAGATIMSASVETA